MNTQPEAKHSVAVTLLLLVLSFGPPGMMLAWTLRQAGQMQTNDVVAVVVVVVFAVCVGGVLAWCAPKDDDVRAVLMGCVSPVVPSLIVVLIMVGYETVIRQEALGRSLAWAVIYSVSILVFSLPALGVFRLVYWMRCRCWRGKK